MVSFPILTWKRIVIDDKETPYIISDKGIIMNDSNGEFMLISPDKDNYPVVKLFVDGEDRVYKVHRLCCEAFNENPFHLKEVDHLNRNHWDSSKENLEFVTGKENMKRLQKMREIEKCKLGNYDKILKERTKYTELQIVQVCIRLSKNQSVTKISKNTLVDKRTIYLIKSGKIWKNISCYFSFDFNDGLFSKEDLESIFYYIHNGFTNVAILSALNLKYDDCFDKAIDLIRETVNKT